MFSLLKPSKIQRFHNKDEWVTIRAEKEKAISIMGAANKRNGVGNKRNGASNKRNELLYHAGDKHNGRW